MSKVIFSRFTSKLLVVGSVLCRVKVEVLREGSRESLMVSPSVIGLEPLFVKERKEISKWWIYTRDLIDHIDKNLKYPSLISLHKTRNKDTSCNTNTLSRC